MTQERKGENEAARIRSPISRRGTPDAMHGWGDGFALSVWPNKQFSRPHGNVTVVSPISNRHRRSFVHKNQFSWSTELVEHEYMNNDVIFMSLEIKTVNLNARTINITNR